MEMHSVIMSIAAGTPTIHPRFAEAGRKAWMLRDLGVEKWLSDLDADPAAKPIAALLDIHDNFDRAIADVGNAKAIVARRQAETMAVVKAAVEEAHADASPYANARRTVPLAACSHTGQNGRVDVIYLDHNATTPIHPEVAEAIHRCQTTIGANPASRHGPGRVARSILEQARAEVAELLGAELSGPAPDRLLFTSGGIEANNLAILGICRKGGRRPAR